MLFSPAVSWQSLELSEGRITVMGHSLNEEMSCSFPGILEGVLGETVDLPQTEILRGHGEDSECGLSAPGVIIGDQ